MYFMMLAAGAAGTPAPTPRMLSSYDPQTVIKFLQAEGYKAKLDTDGEGDPMIRSGADGTNFFVYFYGCKDHQKCKDVQFSSGFDFDDGKGPTLEKVNDWNLNWRFTRAYLDKEHDPMIRMDLLFSQGGMSEQMFRENLETWASELSDFKKHIGW